MQNVTDQEQQVNNPTILHRCIDICLHYTNFRGFQVCQAHHCMASTAAGVSAAGAAPPGCPAEVSTDTGISTAGEAPPTAGQRWQPNRE